MPCVCKRSRLVIGLVGAGTEFVCAFVVWSVRKATLSRAINPQKESKAVKPTYEILCAWCGALIRFSNIELPEQMCLICHARMLNDYFQKLSKDKPPRVSG